MKNPINNFKAFRPVLVSGDVILPQLVTDEEGNEYYVNSPYDTTDLNNVDPEDYSLQSLLAAGIDPQSLSCSTSGVNSSSEIINAVESINSLPTE